MKIGSITVSPVQQERMQRAKLDGIDYGDAKAVQEAREAIMYMGPWDTVVDMCEGGPKREALGRLADVVLREKAATWQQGGANRVLCEELAKLDRREVQARFLEMLSPESRQAILAKFEESEEGIRFLPDTQTELDNLVSITFSHEEGKRLLRASDVADAWQTARTHELEGAKCRNEAQDLRSIGSHSLAADACSKAAEHFSAAGRNTEAAEAYEQAASDLMADGPDRRDDGQLLAAVNALGAAAESWHLAGRHDNAATCRHRQAEHLATLDMLAEAAYCTEMETVQRDLDERETPGRRLPREILGEIASQLPGSASLQAFAVVNKNWNSLVTPWQNQARRVAKDASDDLAGAGPKGLDSALGAIRQLPTSLQLEAFLQLIDRTVVNTDRPSSRDNSFLILDSINRAATDLEPRDRRKLLTKFLASLPELSDERQKQVWSLCLNSIGNINAADPRDMGPAVVALAISFPEDFCNKGNPEYEGLHAMIMGLQDGDPHKRQAQTAFVRRLTLVGLGQSDFRGPEFDISIFPAT